MIDVFAFTEFLCKLSIIVRWQITNETVDVLAYSLSSLYTVCACRFCVGLSWPNKGFRASLLRLYKREGYFGARTRDIWWLSLVERIPASLKTLNKKAVEFALCIYLFYFCAKNRNSFSANMEMCIFVCFHEIHFYSIRQSFVSNLFHVLNSRVVFRFFRTKSIII